MVLSMTGFGSAKGAFNGREVEVQIKTVNHRTLDIHMMLPMIDGALELALQKIIRDALGRGRVDVRVVMNDKNGEQAGLNRTRLEARVDTVLALFNGAWDRNQCLAFCLQQRDVWDSNPTDSLDESVQNGILSLTQEALKKLNQARQIEGDQLKEYMLHALDQIAQHRQAAEKRAPERLSLYRKMLNERIRSLKEDPQVVLDDERLALEVALMADKLDVEEELTRIVAHLKALKDLLTQPQKETECCGKKIDFYLQELNREATTIASKSRDTELTGHSIEIRTLLESMREQTANIQ